MSRHRRNSPNARRRARRKPLRLGRKLLITALALTVCVGVGGWYLYRDLARSIGSSKALTDDDPKSQGGDINILLMGLDSRKDQNGEDLPDDVLDKLHAGSSDIGGYNTNTLMLLHVPADGGRAKAFSIPRDDFVDIPGHGKDKIKKAYGLEKARTEEKLSAEGVTDKRRLEHEGREAGRKKEIETVRKFLGVPIDHFAEVNLAGFFHIADALDGVPVCLNHAVKDKYSGADFKAGRQTLNGQQSLAFVRQRHGLTNGDLDRTRRQQAFLASAAHKLNSAGTFTDPGKLLKLIDTAKKDLVIDEGWDLLSFIKQAKNLSGGNVEFTTLPIEGFGRNRGEDINVIDDVKIKRLIAEQIGQGGQSPSPSPSATDPDKAPSKAPEQRDEKQSNPDDKADKVMDGGGIPCVD
ncbi:LCP family protein [Streptomyces sp. T-3]|nr:LCP family protein [Streptomyces sp. T-3]